MLKLFFILFLIPCTLFSQYSPKEIDSLMTTEYYRLKEGDNFLEIVDLSQKVIAVSKKINYKKGEIYGYTRLGYTFSTLERYKESLDALNHATQLIEQYKFEDHYIRSYIYTGIGRCYSNTNVSYQNGITQYEKAVFHAEKIPNQTEKDMQLSIIYTNLYSAYYNLQNLEKAAQYLRKILSFNKEYSYALIGLAKYHNIYTKNSDSARIYLEKAQKTKMTEYDKLIFYNQWGGYYVDKNEYDKAIAFYKKAEVSAKELKRFTTLEITLTQLYYTYQKKGDLDQALIYYQKAIALTDSLQSFQGHNSDVLIKDIVTKKEKVTKEQLSQTQKIFIGSGILALLVISFFIIKNYRNQKEKKQALDLIEEKEEENQELKQKVNESFNEVIQLAKSNSPQFWNRFTEIYPDFMPKMLAINPDLKAAELTQCAYIYLGFNIKDMATYTFKSEKTIKNYRFNLRAKLNLSREENLMTWIQAYIN